MILLCAIFDIEISTGILDNNATNIYNVLKDFIYIYEQQGDNAEKIARQNQATKSMNVCKTRLEKEKKQQENMKKSVLVRRFMSFSFNFDDDNILHKTVSNISTQLDKIQVK